jgi:hypothetical protein
VVLIAIDHQHQIGSLGDRARFAQLAEQRLAYGDALGHDDQLGQPTVD